MRYKCKYKYTYYGVFIFFFGVSFIIFITTSIRIITEIHKNPPSLFLLIINGITIIITFGLALYLIDSPRDIFLRNYYRKKRKELKEGFKKELKTMNEFFNPETKKNIELDANKLKTRE